jgi:hypothetical protein
MATAADPVTERIKACDRADAALQTALAAILKSRAELAALREDLVALRTDAGVDPVPDEPPVPTPSGAGAVEAGQPPRLRSPVAQIIVDALSEAGDAGLSGMALNKIVAERGFKKDSSEKAKIALKRANLVRHDRIATHWYAPGRGPKHIPGERRVAGGAPSRASNAAKGRKG